MQEVTTPEISSQALFQQLVKKSNVKVYQFDVGIEDWVIVDMEEAEPVDEAKKSYFGGDAPKRAVTVAPEVCDAVVFDANATVEGSNITYLHTCVCKKKKKMMWPHISVFFPPSHCFPPHTLPFFFLHL